MPYPQPVLQERLAGGSPPELEGMRDALDARACDLVAELVSMAAPAAAYPGAVPCVLFVWSHAPRDRTIVALHCETQLDVGMYCKTDGQMLSGTAAVRTHTRIGHSSSGCLRGVGLC